jgi:hypothetical protein
VLEFDPDTLTITISEPTQWFVGQQHYVRLRACNGAAIGPRNNGAELVEPITI